MIVAGLYLGTASLLSPCGHAAASMVMDVSSVTISGNQQWSESMIRRMVPVLRESKIDVAELSRELQLVNDTNAAELTADFVRQQDGRYHLTVAVKENQAAHVAVNVNNAGDDYTGDWRMSTSYTNSNLTGRADTLGVAFVTSPGHWDDVKQAALVYQCRRLRSHRLERVRHRGRRDAELRVHEPRHAHQPCHGCGHVAAPRHTQEHGEGNLWLINPNGIVVGSSAQLNAGSLVLSTLNATDEALKGFLHGGDLTLTSADATKGIEVQSGAKVSAMDLTMLGGHIQIADNVTVSSTGASGNDGNGIALLAGNQVVWPGNAQNDLDHLTASDANVISVNPAALSAAGPMALIGGKVTVEKSSLTATGDDGFVDVNARVSYTDTDDGPYVNQAVSGMDVNVKDTKLSGDDGVGVFGHTVTVDGDSSLTSKVFLAAGKTVEMTDDSLKGYVEAIQVMQEGAETKNTLLVAVIKNFEPTQQAGLDAQSKQDEAAKNQIAKAVAAAEPVEMQQSRFSEDIVSPVTVDAVATEG